MRKWCLLLSLLVLGPTVLSGPGAVAETLNEALATAYRNNPTLRAQQAALRATDETLSQARGGWRPTITALGELSHNNTSIDAFPEDEKATAYSLGLKVQQNLYAGGATRAGEAVAENSIQAGRLQLQLVEQAVLLQAATAYLDVVRDRAVVKLNRRNEARLAKHLEAARARFEAGEATYTDIAKAEAQLAGAEAARIGAEGALTASQAVYREVVGADPANPVTPQEPGFSLPREKTTVLMRAQDNHPEVLASRYAYQAALTSVELQEAAMRPRVDFTGSFGQRNESKNKFTDRTKQNTETESLTLMTSVSVPLYQAGVASSQVRQAKQEAEQKRLLIEEARRKVVRNAEGAWEKLRVARAHILAVNKETSARQIVLENMEQEMQVGSRTFLDVLDAEQDLLDAQVSLVRSGRDVLLARFDLLAAIGGLTPAALGLDVSTYDEKVYYRAVRDKRWGTEISEGSTGDRTSLKRTGT